MLPTLAGIVSSVKLGLSTIAYVPIVCKLTGNVIWYQAPPYKPKLSIVVNVVGKVMSVNNLLL